MINKKFFKWGVSGLCITAALLWGVTTYITNGIRENQKQEVDRNINKESSKQQEIKTIEQVLAEEEVRNKEKLDKGDPLKIEVETPTYDDLKTNPVTSFNKQDETIKKAIKYAHIKLNYMVGFNRIPDEGDFSTLKLNEGKNLEAVIHNVTYIPLKKDLERVIKYINHGTEKLNLQDVIQAHRIIHDIDAHAYKNIDEKDYFDASYTVRIIKDFTK